MEVVIVNSTILFYIHKNPADIRYYYILFNYLIFIKIKYFVFFQEEGTTNMRPDMKVPLAGDLLGRERVTGAKRVRNWGVTSLRNAMITLLRSQLFGMLNKHFLR